MKTIISFFFILTIILPSFSQTKTEIIKKRVNAIYSSIINEYNNGAMVEDIDAKYLSVSFKAATKQCKTVRNRKGDEVGPIDYDHWIQAQDFERLSANVVSITMQSATRAKAIVKLNNYGKTYNVSLILVQERRDWFVDDIYMKNGKSERAIIKTYCFDMEAYLNKVNKNMGTLYDMLRDSSFKQYIVTVYGKKMYDKALSIVEVCGPISLYGSQYTANGAKKGQFGDTEVTVTYDIINKLFNMVVLENGRVVR